MKKSKTFLLSEDDLHICLKNLAQLKIIYESVLQNKKFGEVIMIENHAFLRKDFPHMIEKISKTIMKINACLLEESK